MTASKIETYELAQIVRQSDVISKPIRENYETLRIRLNEAIDDIVALSASTSTSEIIAARDQFDTLDDRLHHTERLLGNGVLTVNRLIDSCDTLDKFGEGAQSAAPALNSRRVEGDKSIELTKSGTGSTSADYAIVITARNYEDNYILFDLFIDSATTLAKIAQINVFLSEDDFGGAPPDAKEFNFTDLKVGWNTITIDVNNPDENPDGVSDDAVLQWMLLDIVTNDAADTTSSVIAP